MAVQPRRDLMQDLDPRQVHLAHAPQMQNEPGRAVEVGQQFLEQAVRGGEEQIPAQLVENDAFTVLLEQRALVLRAQAHRVPLRPARTPMDDGRPCLGTDEQNDGDDDAHADRRHQVVHHRHRRHQQRDQRVVARAAAAQPVEHVAFDHGNRDIDDDSRQHADREQFPRGPEEKHQCEKRRACRGSRPPPRSGSHRDHRCARGRRSPHAAGKAGERLPDALRKQFAPGVVPGFGRKIGNDRCEQRVEARQHRKRERAREHDRNRQFPERRNRKSELNRSHIGQSTHHPRVRRRTGTDPDQNVKRERAPQEPGDGRRHRCEPFGRCPHHDECRHRACKRN